MTSNSSDLKGRRAVIYARYSPGPDQREESIAGQLRECRALAEREKLVVIHEYTDRRMSGTSDDRPDFQQMLFDAERHLFDVVLVWKNDRFARNRYDSAIYKHKLKKAGVRLLYAREHIPDGPEGILFEALMEGMAEYYSANLAQNIRRGLHENALEGKSIGGTTPLGYRLTPEKKYEPDPAKAPIVQEIFRRYAAGDPLIEICRDLNARGYTTALGKHFGRNSLHRMLANEKYIGIFRYQDIINDSLIPAIIDTETFAAVKQRLAANKQRPHSKQKAEGDFLLTGKLFCGHCGQPMGGSWGTSKSGRQHCYYVCNGHKNKTGCKKKAEQKQKLEDKVINAVIDNVLSNDDVISLIVDQCMAIQARDIDKGPLIALKKELRQVEEKHANIMAAIEAGIITASTRSRLVELEGRLEELKQGIAEAEIAPPQISRDMLLFMFEKFKGRDLLDDSFRRDIVQTFVYKVFVFDSRLVITFNYSGDNTKEYTLRDIETDTAEASLYEVEQGALGVRLMAPKVHHLRKSRTLATAFYFVPGIFGIVIYG